jgi:hypothetical protein
VQSSLVFVHPDPFHVKVHVPQTGGSPPPPLLLDDDELEELDDDFPGGGRELDDSDGGGLLELDGLEELELGLELEELEELELDGIEELELEELDSDGGGGGVLQVQQVTSKTGTNDAVAPR